MRVIKYFFEEPTLLDFPESTSKRLDSLGDLTQKLDAEKPFYRGYLAASDLENNTIGGSALDDGAAARILGTVLEGPIWLFGKSSEQDGTVRSNLLTKRDEIIRALSTMTSESVMVSNLAPTKDEMDPLIGRTSERNSYRAIVRLLEAGATVVLPEPAHTGHDWSVFSAEPLSERVRDAMRAARPSDCRSFVVPYQEARGEHKFYFEQYDVELFAKHEIKDS